ncbi:MAG: amino acid racemase [Opitutaceae bacterium]|jgi:aspartate racemase|nr:amino acid racemase [Opitutaceae bacterium]
MKTLGLLGGLSHQAMRVYTRLIHEEVGYRLRQPDQAAIIALDRKPGEFATLGSQQDWSGLRNRLAQDAKTLESAGAESLVICSGLLHAVAGDIAPEVNIPVLSAVTAVMDALRRMKVARVGLLGSFDEREAKMWKDCLENNLVPDVMVPVSADQQHLAEIVRTELTLGIVREPSRVQVAHIAASFRKAGARAVVITAPELRLIFGESESVLPVFDAARLHVAAAVDWALGLENVRVRT